MEVTKIVINGIEITTFDKPIGLDVNKLLLDRDFQYSCIDTTIEVELKFYCASGKEQLDAEYESKGVEGSGYVEIIDECGTNAQTYRFNLDFKKYNNQGDFTTVGLIDVNSLWKQDLNKEINLDYYSSGVPTNFASDFYIRNLPLNYDYYSEGSSSEERLVGSNIVDINRAAGGVKVPFITCIFPKTNTTINDLEDGSQLLSETYFLHDFTALPTLQAMLAEYIDPSGTTLPSPPVYTSAGLTLVIPDIEPQPIFDNVLEDGTLTITTSGSTHFEMYFNGTTINRTFTVREFKECVGIGTSWTEMRGYMSQLNDTAVNVLAIGGAPLTWTYNHPTISTKTTTRTYDVKKGEKVWIWYQMFHEPYMSNIGATIYQFDHYQIDIDRDITIDFTLTKNVANSISSSSDVEPYHTLVKAYYGQTILNHIFNTINNLGQTSCYTDLWFSKGDLIRGKINKADTIVKPSDFFRELEKVVCCGLGYFYDTNPTGIKKLMSVYDFYSDTLVPSQYQFDYNDLIDGKIELTPFLSPYYKEVQIGYATSKDSEKDFCKQNTYSIDNASESTYSKISDFISSMFVITRAIKLGTEDKDLEFDKNIFILSGGQLGIYNATLSQTSGVLADNIFVNPTNSAGINRRYATALNLFRHLYKWGFSLFADKTELKVVKYEGNTIYDWEIRDTTGSSTDPYYHSLSLCKLPLDNYAKVDKSIEDIYTDFIQSGLYVPTQITFKTANLSSLDLIAMRAHQYDLFSVTDGTNTYYGNLISANLEDDVTEIKLLRRFKNGI